MIRPLQEAGEKAPKPLVDKHEVVIYSVPSAPRLIPYDAVPYCEDVVFGALPAGAVSGAAAAWDDSSCSTREVH
jgi:hypothetical protein